MNETLTMKDGTTVRSAQTVGSIQGLWIHIREGLTFSQAYSLFSDPEKTGRIISRRNDGTHIYDGFTRVTEILEISDQFVTATMEQA